MAECVQPAPCVAATRAARPGSRRARVPSKRWSTGVVAVAAGDDRRPARRARASRSASSRRAPSRAGERDGLVQVRRDHRREREEPRDERADRVVLEQLRARARDHHRVDDERHRMRLEVAGDRLDQRAARRASRSSRRRRRCRRRPRRAARRRTPAAARGSPSRRSCSARSARRAPTCRAPRPRRTPSGRPGCRRRRRCRRSRSSVLSVPHAAPFAGMTRIRFDGCDLSPDGAPRCRRAELPAPASSAAPAGRSGRCTGRRSRALARAAGPHPRPGGAATPPPSKPILPAKHAQDCNDSVPTS